MIPGIVPCVLVDFGNPATGKPLVAPAALAACAAALTKQAQQHLALPPPYGWGIGASVRAAANPKDVRPGEWVIGLFAHADQPGALGYHDVTPHGTPFAKVFPLLDAQDHAAWQVTISHELIEMLLDALCAECVMGPDGKFWAKELCDAVEQVVYMIDGVPVSDFVLPPYFEAVRNRTGLKLDFCGKVREPLEILPGGYGQWFDPNAGWQQVVSQEKAPRSYRRNARGRGWKRQERFEASRRLGLLRHWLGRLSAWLKPS